MSKKTYHIVDPETGKFVTDVDIGGFDKLAYQMAATGWDKRLFWALHIALLLCVVLTIAAPVLRASFPVFYDNTYTLLLIGDIIVLRWVVLTVRWFFRSKFKKEQEIEQKEDEKKVYRVIDPETEQIVGTLTSNTEDFPYDMDDTATSGYRFARALYLQFNPACFSLTKLSGLAFVLVPNDWKPYAMIAFILFFVLTSIGHGVYVLIMYDQKSKEGEESERSLFRFTLTCFVLTIPFVIASFALSGGWRTYTIGLAVLFAALTTAGVSACYKELKGEE